MKNRVRPPSPESFHPPSVSSPGEEKRAAIMKTSFTPERAAFVALFCEAFLHGTYTILFACTMYLFWKRKSFGRTWLGSFIRTLTILLYGISTTHLALAFTVAYRSFAITEDADVVYDDLDLKKNVLHLVQMSLDATNCILADIILTWRVWALCNRNMKILILPSFLLVCTTGTPHIAFFTKGTIRSHGLSENGGSSASFSAVFSPSVAPWTYGLACSVLITNVLCTGLISWKVALHHRALSKAGLGHLASTYRWIALIICESGALYLAAWILFILFAVIDHPAILTITDMLAQLTGIVPTLVVVLVSMKADSVSVHKRLTSSVSGTALSGAHHNIPPTLPTFIAAKHKSAQVDYSPVSPSELRAPEFELNVRTDKSTRTSWADDTLRVVDIRRMSQA
ncbi:hypothetical protein DL96DRAFT_1620639 [Flagelloscypha sp. PMI_526]|nr:hypothetical protein DL96DRAFT_1620639 [Flagelloscypha sp. PMI_526]